MSRRTFNNLILTIAYLVMVVFMIYVSVPQTKREILMIIMIFLPMVYSARLVGDIILKFNGKEG